MMYDRNMKLVIIGNQNIYGINGAASENVRIASSIDSLAYRGNTTTSTGLFYTNLLHLYTCVSVLATTLCMPHIESTVILVLLAYRLSFDCSGVLSKRNGDFKKLNGNRSHRLSVPFTVGRCRSDARAS